MADVSVKMGVSGIAQFKQGMKDAEASVKTLDAAMKANEQSFKRTGDAESHLAAQTTLLNQKLQQQKTIVKNAEQALKQMEANGVRTTSAAYQNMQRKLIEAQSGMMDTEAELDNLGTKASGAAEKTDQLSNSLGGLNKKISLDQVISAVGKVTDGLERAGQKAVQLGKAIWDELMESARWADDSATMAMMYGVDLDTFLRVQKLVQNGMDTSVEAILKSQSKLKKNVGGGSDSFMATMKELGLVVTEYGGKVAEGIDHLITDDSVELFWKAGQAIMSLGDEYEQEAKAQELFGKSWRELIPLFTQFKSQEEFDKALENVTVNSEEEVSVLEELNDKVGELKGNFDTLENKVMAGLAPAMTKAAEALNGLLGNLLEYLDTPEGQQALDDMAKAVEGLFSDISQIDPKEVVKGFADVFNGIVSGLQWLEKNSGTVIGAMEAIVAGWGVLKLTGGALEIYKLIQGISGLAGAGAATAAGEAGAAAGSAWGGGFAAAVMKAAPWLVGLYTLLNPAETAGNDWDVLFDEKTGKLTSAGWQDYYNNPDNWADTLREVGDIFGDLARITSDENAINAMAKYRMYGDMDTLIRELEALGYVKKPTDEELRGDSGVPETAYTKEGPDGIIYQYDADGNKIGTTLPKSTGPLYDRNGNIIPEKYEYTFPESDEVVRMTEKQAEAVEKFWDVWREKGSDFTDQDWSEYEDAFKGQEELFDTVDRLMSDFFMRHNWDDEELANLPDDLFTIEAEPELPADAASILQGYLDKMHLSAVVNLTPGGLMGGFLNWPRHANGLPMVPFDGYPALLDKGEQVVPAREVGSRSYSSNMYIESMYMNNGQDAEGLAAAIAAANRRTMRGFGS